ncbi:MAG: T9SS type B sorting domain-containing protein [Maribacter sp.]|nr:T9SS type B sorting domain-containing protein [Maribacter sp.]
MEHSISTAIFKKNSVLTTSSKIMFLLFFLITTLLGAQQADLRPYVTEGADCVSQDVQLISAKLDGEGCTTCLPGEVLNLDLLITIHHNTNSDRPALAVFGDLTTTFADGSSTVSDFIKCSGPIVPKGKILNGVPVASGGNGIQTINYGSVSYVCGSKLEVSNILVTWTVPSDGDCPIEDANPHPKCGFQEGTLIIIPPLQATAEAFCSPENLIDLTPVGGTAPYTYNWSGPNGFTSTSEDISEAAPGYYEVTITDFDGCSVNTGITQIDCCEFFANGILDPGEIIIEGCDTSDLPQPFTDPTNVFDNITPIPCGDLVMINSETVNGSLCPDGLLISRIYTLFDDLNNNDLLDNGEESVTSVQNFKIQDTINPEFVELLPDDTTVECDAIPTAPVLTATDNCNPDVNVVFEETQSTSSCPQIYTLTRTWTATDACNNQAIHVQTIEVLDTSAPVFNESLPTDTVAAFDNIPSPATLTASDSCDTNPQVNLDETYIGDNGSTTYTVVRTWTASDCAGNSTEHTQFIYVTENGDPIGLAINDISLNESAGSASFTVVLTGITSTDFTVNFTSANGSAIAPDDYDTLSGTLPFNGTHGETQTVVVTINDDNIVESTENYTIELSALSTTEIAINDANGLGTILDNDTASISINDIDINENVGVINVQVVLNGDIEESFSVDFTTVNGTALSTSDYNTSNGQVTFPNNATNGNIQNIAITINDDNLIEATENFLVDLSNIIAIGDVTIADNQANVNIIDNDSVLGTGISFETLDVQVTEGVGVTATFNVVLTGAVQDAFDVSFETAFGTADATDLVALNDILSFNGTDGEQHPITVTILNDEVIEPTEAFTVNLTGTTNVLVPINTPQANGSILDDDNDPSLGIQFDVTDLEVNENAGIISLNVTLNADVQDEFTVEFNAIDGTAINSKDYTPIINSLTFGGSNSNTQTITIDIIDDIIIEDTENFQVVLTDISTPLVNILANDTATVNIIDNDGNEGFPEDITLEACETIPNAADITSDSVCPIMVVFEETIADQDENCPIEYIITRTWTITDCVNNTRIHVQVITIVDTIAPTFVEALPQDMTVTCDEIPEADILTALDNCDTNVAVTFDETVTNDSNCATGYVITRVWNAIDCAGNSTTHTQIITVMSNGPISASSYEEEITIMCGDPMPEVPELEFMGGCGDYNVILNEETQFSEESDDYMIVRTWNVTDACGNTATFEQLIFVMQPEKEYVSIDICVEDMTIDLTSYLPEDFDTNGVFTANSGNVNLNGNFFDPIDHMVGDYSIAYTSLDSSCKYYVDFEIKVNADCVPCGRKDIIASKTVTPNGDGVNDYFEIKGVDNCDFRFDVMLFNRWGSKVYEGVEYQNDWGGSSPNNSFGNSGMLPAGTYYYIIKVTNRDFEPINGYIYLGTK